MRCLNIIAKNAEICSGSCSYCAAGIDNAIKHSKADLELIDNKNYATWEVDFSALEKAIRSTDAWNGNDKIKLVIWGGDPLTNFQITQEIFDFSKWLFDQRGNYEIHTSTNGLAFQRPEIIEWVNKNNVIVQLSHDGVGQELRTGNIEPLDFCENVNNLRIACLLHRYNSDIFKCIEYIDKFYKKWNKRASMRFMRPMVGHYDLPYLNKTGLYNGEHYDELKSKPFGNLYIENFDFDKHALDNFLTQFAIYCDRVLNKTITPDGIHWMDYGTNIKWILKEFNPLAKKKGLYSCEAFQVGASDKSPNIDTLGKFTPCNLLSSDKQVGNPSNEKPAYCEGCKYHDSKLCGFCGNLPVDKHENCEFLYRLNDLFVILRRAYKDLLN